MERLGALLRQKEFHALLFCLCVVLMNWPFVEFSDVGRLKAVFIYLFLAWSFIIFLLFLVSRSLRNPPPDED
jgi:hypothetical protein